MNYIKSYLHNAFLANKKMCFCNLSFHSSSLMKNIYIIGRPADLYRTQTFVKSVMDSYDRWNLSLSYFVSGQRSSSVPHGSIVKYLIKIPLNGIALSFSLFEIIRADYVYLVAMGLFQRRAKIEFWFARLLKKKIISECYISFYDTLALDRKTVPPHSRQACKLIKIDREMQKCFRVIYLNRTEAGRYASLAGLTLAQINYRIIPLTVKERSKGQLPYWNEGTKPFTMVWWGTYIPLHGLDKLIRLMSILHLSAQVHLYIFGNSEEKSLPYKKMIEEEGLSSCITIQNDSTFSNGRLESFLTTHCDLALGSFGDSEKAKSVILNKCIEATAMKIPLLTQFSEAFEEYFGSDSLFYTANTLEAMEEKIRKIMRMSSSEIRPRIELAYGVYKNNFSVENVSSCYTQLIDEL